MSVAAPDTLELAAQLIGRGPVMLLSGAGLSTESGIPDYRGPTGSTRRGTPMTYEEFTKSEPGRQRYWARSHAGWSVVAAARPNDGHRAVVDLERSGRLSGIVTQNVDGLQQAAGSEAVIELHGNLATVVCLGCGCRSDRSALDRRLRDANPQWERGSGATQPDGDATVGATAVAEFRTVDCSGCGGMLKPDVVFFGESVPKERVQRCFELLESSSALLVVGSSLTVMSGFRFAMRAEKLGLPVVIVNHGATRADDLAAVKVEGPLGTVLPQLVRQLAAL